jgi:type III restriction enzyme
MHTLYEILAAQVDSWRSEGYPCANFPAVAEILAYQTELDNDAGDTSLRYLRVSQMRALETYWYLRLVESTPHIKALYLQLHSRKLFPSRRDLIDALGVPREAWLDERVDTDLDTLFTQIGQNDDFVRQYSLEALRETLTLSYPSYILALAMGAGKTVLIGAIIATEFAMALEYPRDQYPNAIFVENALVFAPGLTILESLRELAEMPYDLILPPRFYRQFAPNHRMIFTKDGEKDVPVIRASSFNIIVTNTEKIRIQKEKVKQADIRGLFAKGKEDEARTEVANLRLQTIASLPHLAIFSDEAHHTYGQSLGEELKKVRLTVDYLHQNTNLIVTVNTTGTPFFKKQTLKDVVIWYGLSQGISDGILKEVKDGVQAYRFDDSDASPFVSEVVRDFFNKYSGVSLPNGASAKLAIYFPQTDDLEELRPTIESTIIELGQAPAIVLRNTSESTQAEIDAFNRLNNPASQHRVILLVNKGTEGWNCPSLFACALARKLKTSNNFVLQASTRCLRQVPGNNFTASIYLSDSNRKTLDDQLVETYGESVESLAASKAAAPSLLLTLRKHDPPPLRLLVPISVVRPKDGVQLAMLDGQLSLPNVADQAVLERTVYTLRPSPQGKTMLDQSSMSQVVTAAAETVDLYTAAVELADLYRMSPLKLRKCLHDLYPSDEMPLYHFPYLARQIEVLTSNYEVITSQVEITLAIVKRAGWRNPDGSYSITVTEGTRENIMSVAETPYNALDFGFHYDPYKFSSGPERRFFEALLRYLNYSSDDVEDVYYTGGIIDDKKTDFFIEWADLQGKLHQYYPDFVIRKRPATGSPPGSGPCLIVEIKESRHRDTIEKERAGDPSAATSDEARKAFAAERWVFLNGGTDRNALRYHMIYDNETPLLAKEVKDFIQEIKL